MEDNNICTIQETHCHDKKTGNCIKFIEDCEEHWAQCSDDCHDECACQDHRYVEMEKEDFEE